MTRTAPIHFSHNKKTQSFINKDVVPPCLFEIVCKPTGRRYIGFSKDIATRLPMYRYYLKYSAYYFSSSPFFGSALLQKDIAEHGFGTKDEQTFELNILKALPLDTDDTTGNRAKLAYIKKHGKENVYNRHLEHVGFHRSAFYEIDEEMKALEDARTEIYAEQRRLAEEHKKFHAFASERNRQLLAVRGVNRDDINEEMRTISMKKQELASGLVHQKAHFKAVSVDVKRLHNKLVKKYSNKLQDVAPGG